jgi:hypothetical protein
MVRNKHKQNEMWGLGLGLCNVQVNAAAAHHERSMKVCRVEKGGDRQTIAPFWGTDWCTMMTDLKRNRSNWILTVPFGQLEAMLMDSTDDQKIQTKE